ncbi:hypothetical protein I3842_Q030100 [Carya illinoinensis]|uniref:Uncharacterized protein n=1 Tax=Carya illinoinensis TaxID=32201 RepID=A0A922D399_CARIL|nr:hypothetical protein I3842_Q030100 [Carya illinoinensis]
MGGGLLILYALICLVVLSYVFHDASIDLSHGTMKFPGSKGQRPSQKKVRWNPESELQKLDYLEKLEQRAQGQENKDEKEKKEGENEDEDENDGEEDIEEEPSDDDYFQNVEFDDDDDDFNDVDDGGEDEGTF